MTNDEILQAAKEAGFAPNRSYTNIPVTGYATHDLSDQIKAFATIIEKRTIERCAVVCETQMDLREEASAALKAKESLKSGDEGEALDALRHESNVRLYHSGINKCAAAIRKLGEQ